MIFEGRMRLTIGPNRTKIEMLDPPLTMGNKVADEFSDDWFAGKLAEFNRLLAVIEFPLDCHRPKDKRAPGEEVA